LESYGLIFCHQTTATPLQIQNLTQKNEYSRLAIMKLKQLLFFVAFLLCSTYLHAQVTTASMSGLISDEKGEGLVGATVVAKHVPSGSQYGTSTNNDGRFTLQDCQL
jgi:hypothetical protein